MKQKYLLGFILPLLLLTACKKDQPKPIHLQGITLSKDTVNLVIGAQASITVTLNPSNAVDTALVFSSSDSTIAKVKKPGFITGLKVGKAVITVKNSANTVSKTCVVNVLPVGVTSVTLNKTTLNILINNTDSVKATVLSVNATYSNITWTSSDNTTASVNSKGIITAIKLGTVTITATSQDGKFSAACKVTVRDMVFFIDAIANYDLQTVGTTNTEAIWFFLKNNSAYPVVVTQWDVYDAKGFSIGEVTGTATIQPGIQYTSLTQYFKIGYYDPGQVGLDDWPVVVLFNCKGKNYKLTLNFEGQTVTDL